MVGSDQRVGIVARPLVLCTPLDSLRSTNMLDLHASQVSLLVDITIMFYDL